MTSKRYDRRVLTEEQAIAICIDQRDNMDIAKEYGVTRATISRIKNGHRYANVTQHVRDGQGFQIRINGLKAERNRLITMLKMTEEEIERLENVQASDPRAVHKKEELELYKRLVRGS